MTMQSFNGFAVGGPFIFGTASINTATLVVDADGEKVGITFPAVKTGNITKIHGYTATVTTGGTLDCRAEGVSAGFPSGSLLATNTNGSAVIANTDDNIYFSATLTAAAAVAVSDPMAIVLSLSGAGNMQIGTVNGANLPFGANSFPRPCHYTTSWAGASSSPIIFLEYDDGEIVSIYTGMNGAVSSDGGFDSADSPDERGNIFQVPVPARVYGVFGLWDINSGTTADIILYDAADNVLASYSCSETELSISVSIRHFVFDSPVDIDANTDYRLVIKATHPSATSAIYKITFPAGVSWPIFGDTIMKTARTDLGAWSETNTDVLHLIPVFSGFDDGASAGGLLTHPGMGGGMRG